VKPKVITHGGLSCTDAVYNVVDRWLVWRSY